jgi:hypothetical protein
MIVQKILPQHQCHCAFCQAASLLLLLIALNVISEPLSVVKGGTRVAGIGDPYLKM